MKQKTIDQYFLGANSIQSSNHVPLRGNCKTTHSIDLRITVAHALSFAVGTMRFTLPRSTESKTLAKDIISP